MIEDDMTNNAKWLYSRCSRARASMGTSLSTLDLCLKIFEVIKETDDEDDIQIPIWLIILMSIVCQIIVRHLLRSRRSKS